MPLDIGTKAHPTDLVTTADREAESAIRQMLADQFPDIPVAGEESGGHIPDAGPCWVVDPLDGTGNYVAGLPFYCASVALIWDGRPVVAAICAPEQEEMFSASAGAGARVNGQPIRVAAGSDLTRLVVAARPSLNRNTGRVDNLVECAALASASLGVRSLGTSALELGWVACGRLGAFYHPRLCPWDVAAGALLVVEAGGCVTRADGSGVKWTSGQALVASNGATHAELLARVGCE